MNMIVAGSPRKGKNSDAIAEIAAGMLENPGVVYLRDKRIAACRACESCHRQNGKGCVFPDDFQALYPMVMDSTTLLIITPIYWWGLTAQTKAFIDRLYSIDWKNAKLRKLAFIVNGGEADTEDREYSLLRDLMKEMASYLDLEFSFLALGTPADELSQENSDRVRAFVSAL